MPPAAIRPMLSRKPHMVVSTGSTGRAAGCASGASQEIRQGRKMLGHRQGASITRVCSIRVPRHLGRSHIGLECGRKARKAFQHRQERRPPGC